MDGAKYVSAAGAEWRRWRTAARCQPIGCPRVMHITSPPPPHPTPPTQSPPPKKVCFSSPITSLAFFISPPQHLPRPLKRPPEVVRLRFSKLKLGQSLCSGRSHDSLLMEDAFRTARYTHLFFCFYFLFNLKMLLAFSSTFPSRSSFPQIMQAVVG